MRGGITSTLKQTLNFWCFEFTTDNGFFEVTENYFKILLKNCQA